MIKITAKKPLGHTIWFKMVLTILVFLPSVTQIPYNPANTTDVVASVMAYPLITSIPLLLPISKLILLIVVLLPLISSKFSERVLIAYYCIILLVVGIFQNMSITKDYGFVWLLGNTFIQFLVLIYCLYDFFNRKSVIKIKDINKKRLWVVLPMLLAFLMPYSVNTYGGIRPSLTISVLWNESGVTYCMITPVIVGIMILFSKKIYKPLMSVVSYVGLVFGLLNMITWFGLQNENWWMGILHLPLLILSFYGLIISKKEKIVVVQAKEYSL